MKKAILILIIMCAFPSFGFAERILNGVRVLTKLEEFSKPDSCAIIVVDMQNGWTSTEGVCYREDKAAKPSIENHQIMPHYQDQVNKMRNLIAAARKTGVPIVTVEYIHQNALGRSLMMGPDMWVHRNADGW